MSTLDTRSTTPFGAKTSKGQLYGGFSVMIAGIVLGVAALALFLISLAYTGDAQKGTSGALFTLRRIALPTGTIGLGAIFFGLTLALPTKVGMRLVSYIGATFIAVAALFLAFHYPNNFNVASRTSTQFDYLPIDLGIAVVGLAALVAASFTSIIGFYLDRTRVVEGGKDGEEEDEFGAGYEIPDWVVERDIDFAMKKYGVTFANEDRDSNKLYVNIPTELGGNVKVGGLGKARVVQLDAEQVDSGVAQLSGVRPNKKGALPGEWADESTRALVAFRRQKAANPTAFTPKVGFWAKVKAFFLGTGKGPKVQPRAPTPPSTGGRAPSPNGATPAPRRGKTIVIPDDK